MVQNTMSTAILIIASVIAVVTIVTAVYPTLFSSSQTLLSSTSDTDGRTKTLLTLSSYSFVNATTLDVWAKNTGRTSVSVNELQSARVYYGNDTGSLAYYNASFTIEAPNNSDNYLDPGETLKLEIISGSLPQNSGVHRIRLALPNGAISEYALTI
jgi:flagellar protein FlaG